MIVQHVDESDFVDLQTRTYIPARFSEVSVPELFQYLLLAQPHVSHTDRQNALLQCSVTSSGLEGS